MSFSFKEGNILTKGHFQVLCFLHTTQLLMASILLHFVEASLGGKETCPVLPCCPLEDSLGGAGGASLQIARLAFFLPEKQDETAGAVSLSGWALREPGQVREGSAETLLGGRSRSVKGCC